MDFKLYQDIQAHVKKQSLIKPDSCLVVGLSGGPDSVLLLHFLAWLRPQYNLRLIAAHLDHEWRFSSAQDLIFCETLAAQLNITFIAQRASELSIKPHREGSTEAQGRFLRRFFLEQVMQSYHADKIVVGHHLDDQFETFFFRLIRGAGLTGLAAMHARDGHYIRPLLKTRKQEIVQFLQTHDIPYVLDATNENPAFLRNCIRSNVIPALRTCDARFETSLARTIENLQEADAFVESQAAQAFSAITTVKDELRWISLKDFFELDLYLQKRVLMIWFCSEKIPFTPSQAFFEEVLRFLRSPVGGSHTFYGAWMLIKKQQKVSVKPLVSMLTLS
jgi:tRNA(Ile)-lysidine synthase